MKIFNLKFLFILFLPFLVSGCFFKTANNQNQDLQPEYEVYRSATVNNFSFSARYLKNWQLAENSSGDLADFKDQVMFIGPAEKIEVKVVKLEQKPGILKDLNIESQSQTEVSAFLAQRYIVGSAGGRLEIVVVDSGDFSVFLKTNLPGSVDFIKFTGDFILSKTVVQKGGQINLKLYFDNGSDSQTCQATGFKQVVVSRQSEDLSLIPQAVQLLIQESEDPTLTQNKLSTAIPFNTRLLSFGYEDNKAIVNFNAELNSGGGSCLMTMRRSQIEKTLMALNEVSDLEIKQVEIQVDGNAETALQP